MTHDGFLVAAAVYPRGNDCHNFTSEGRRNYIPLRSDHRRDFSADPPSAAMAAPSI